jgi:hypothetical protein
MFQIASIAGTYEYFTSLGSISCMAASPLAVTSDGRLWFNLFDPNGTGPHGLAWFDGTNSGLYSAPRDGGPQWGGLPHAQISSLKVRELPNGYELWMSCASRGIAVLSVVEETSTPTPTSTATPAPPTITPTTTPIATSTATPMSTPTATPDPIPQKGMELILDDHNLTAGERFNLHILLHNPGPADYEADAYILLDVYGDYWSWPNWKNISEGLDHTAVTCPAMSSLPQAVLDFTWPEGAGTASELAFFGALFEPDTFDMIGDLQFIMWGFE